MLSYPLIPPASPSSQKIRLGRRSMIARAASPFSGVQQIQEYPGEWWEASVLLPPMKRVDAEKWVAFLLAARGGTFYLGDTAATTPQPGTGPGLLVNGGSQSGKVLLVKNAVSSTLTPAPGILNMTAGDYFSLGAGGLGSDAATRVSVASAGSALTMYYQGLAAAVVGNTYITTLRVEDGGLNGSSGVMLKDNLGGSIDFSAVGSDGLLQLITVAVNTNPYRIQIVIPGGFFFAGFYAWGASMQRAGIVENLVPAANRNLAGWTNLAGATTGYTKRLHKLTRNAYGVPTNGSGTALVDVFPALRPGPMSDSDALQTGFNAQQKPVGLFRLADNSCSYDIGSAMEYGISFNAEEAL